MKQEIEQIIRKNLPEERNGKLLEDKEWQPRVDDYQFGFNDRLAQINTSLIADEVRKVVEKTYDPIFKWLLGENGDFPESEPGKRYNFRTELRKRLQLLSNLSPNKENKNNER